MSDDGRRGTDPLIIDMHGMIQRLDQKMDDTQRWFKSAHEAHLEADKVSFKRIDDELAPIAAAYRFLRALAWPAGVVLTPTLAWIGYVILERVKR